MNCGAAAAGMEGCAGSVWSPQAARRTSKQTAKGRVAETPTVAQEGVILSTSGCVHAWIHSGASVRWLFVMLRQSEEAV